MPSGELNFLSVYYVMRALAAADLLEADVTKGLVDYLAKRGYDSDDLLKLSDGDISGYRRGIHYLMLVSHSCPGLKNKSFNTHA